MFSAHSGLTLGAAELSDVRLELLCIYCDVADTRIWSLQLAIAFNLFVCCLIYA